MGKTAIKLSIAALLFYVGCFVARYIGDLPPRSEFAASDMGWSAWDYLSLGSLLLALSFTVAAVKLRKH